MMAPYADEIAHYRFEELQPRGVVVPPRADELEGASATTRADGLRIPVAPSRPSRALFAGTYAVEAEAWVDRMSGEDAEMTLAAQLV